MMRATILPAADAPPLAERYEQAARAVEAYTAARRALSVAVLGTGSPRRLADALEVLAFTRTNASAALRDLSGDYRMLMPTTMRLVVWAAQLRDCETTVTGDEDEAAHLRDLAAAASVRRDTVPCGETMP